MSSIKNKNCIVDNVEGNLLTFKIIETSPFHLTPKTVRFFEEACTAHFKGEKFSLLIDGIHSLFSMDLDVTKMMVNSEKLNKMIKGEAWIINRFATRNTIRFYRLVAENKRPINVFWNKDSARLWLNSLAVI